MGEKRLTLFSPYDNLRVTTLWCSHPLSGDDWSQHVGGHDETALPPSKAIKPSPISVLKIYFKEDEMTNIEIFNEKAVEFLSNTKAAIAQSSTTDEVMALRDRAEALRVFCQSHLNYYP